MEGEEEGLSEYSVRYVSMEGDIRTKDVMARDDKHAEYVALDEDIYGEIHKVIDARIGW